MDMDIDLLFTDDGEAGLICGGNLVKKAAGLLLDTETGLLTLEYTDMDFAEMNIPVDEAFFALLEQNPYVHVGAVKSGHIAQAYQVPLMFLDDPYRGGALGRHTDTANPLRAFEHFMRRCTNGQPVQRADLGNEDSMGCILGDSAPSSLQFAPHLAQQHALESAPRAAPASTPRMSAPGLGGGGSGSTGRTVPRRPARRSPDTEDD